MFPGAGWPFQPVQLWPEALIHLRMTHLGPVSEQSHVQAVVGGHQVGPGPGSVSLLAVDGGGFGGSVGA